MTQNTDKELNLLSTLCARLLLTVQGIIELHEQQTGATYCRECLQTYPCRTLTTMVNNSR